MMLPHSPATYPNGSTYYVQAGEVGPIRFDMKLCTNCGLFYADGTNDGQPIPQTCAQPVLSVRMRAEDGASAQVRAAAGRTSRITHEIVSGPLRAKRGTPGLEA